MENYQSYNDGGFMQGFTSPNSQQSPHEGGEKKSRNTTMTPVCIRHLKSGAQKNGDSFILDNVEINQVCIIGAIREIDAKQTKIVYKVEDHTGVMDVTQWISSGGDGEDGAASTARHHADCREGMYVKCYGKFQLSGDKALLNAFGVVPVTDHNEITHHLMDTLMVYLANTRGQKNKPNLGIGATSSTSTSTSAAPLATGGQRVAAGAYDAHGAGDEYRSNGLKPEQNAVLDAIKSCPSEQGLSVYTIIDSLRGRFSEPQIRQALNFLGDEGHIFSTIDDDHYKAID